MHSPDRINQPSQLVRITSKHLHQFARISIVIHVAQQISDCGAATAF